jgi:hypothetical protein
LGQPAQRLQLFLPAEQAARRGQAHDRVQLAFVFATRDGRGLRRRRRGQLDPRPGLVTAQFGEGLLDGGGRGHGAGQRQRLTRLPLGQQRLGVRQVQWLLLDVDGRAGREREPVGACADPSNAGRRVEAGQERAHLGDRRAHARAPRGRHRRGPHGFGQLLLADAAVPLEHEDGEGDLGAPPAQGRLVELEGLRRDRDTTAKRDRESHRPPVWHRPIRPSARHAVCITAGMQLRCSCDARHPYSA